MIGRFLLSLKIMLLVAGMAGTSLLLILVYDAVTQSSYFEARTITVEGIQNLTKEGILKQAGVGIHENILSVNVNMVRHRLMENPWIAAAEIERALPDTIHIRVQEHLPIAIVDLNGMFYLDERGEVFKPVEPTDRIRVPLVTGLALSDMDFDDTARSETLRAVLEVLRLSRRQEKVIPFYKLHRVQIDRQTGLTLHASLASPNLLPIPAAAPAVARNVGTPVKAGDGALAIKLGFEDYESKFSRLQFMASYLKSEDRLSNIRFIDLNDTDRVVIKPSPTGQDEIRSVAGDQKPWSSRRKEV
ncbi:MAG: FtsQ-type POTRA domain-containing protein [Deltaproteobacteria bacterium]|jgi:cell division protein FtsQ